MLFEVAGIELSPWVPPLVSLGISFFTSMGGVSGAFLLLPFQMSVLGYTSPSVSATNQFYNIVAIPSGVWRFLREGRMVWPLTWTVVAGTLPGVLIGAMVRVRCLPDARNFKLFMACVLLYIGTRMALDLLRQRRGAARGTAAAGERLAPRPQPGCEAIDRRPACVRVLRRGRSRIAYEFQGVIYDVSAWGILALALAVGVIGGTYGIGGGAIIAPFLVSVFGLPVYTVAGASLMGTFITSVAGVAFYQAIAPFHPGMSVAPDWLLGLLFGLGGIVGMYLGARCQKYVPARYIKWMLSGLLLFLALKYAGDFLR